ncbi:MAG: hypothetical protein PF588_07935 [Candidatus Kapabacteria bacterium]|nr:hypothetical protein [Candidatus Kapabacteria bacterium]
MSKNTSQKALVVFFSIALIGMVYLLFFSVKYDPGLVVYEKFLDTNDQGVMLFAFVETGNYDSLEMYEFGQRMFDEEYDKDTTEDAMSLIAVIHFFNRADSVILDEKMTEVIRRNYFHLENAEYKLINIPDGYIYTSFSGDYTDDGYIVDTLFQSQLIVPRSGISARNLMRKPPKKIYTKSINTSVTFTQRDSSAIVDSLISAAIQETKTSN